MSQTDLLRLLEQAYPGRAQADLLAMIESTPNRPEKSPRMAQDGKLPAGGKFPPRKPQRPPVRAVAIERRRRLAYGGPLPPQLASRFTLGELACLRIVGDEVRERGFCALTLGAIAARAGCCRELAKRAVRKAAREELMTVEERRRPGQVNLPNVIRIISREWLAWIARGPRPSSKGIGETKSAPTDTKIQTRSESRSVPNAPKGFRQGRGAGPTAGHRSGTWRTSRWQPR